MACPHKLKGLCNCPKEPEPEVQEEHVEVLGDAADQLIWALENPDTRAEYERQIEAEELRGNLSMYCRAAWHVIEQSTKLSWNWHHELMCRVLQGMFEDWERGQDDETYVQRVKNAILNVPPGSLKSRIISVFYPTWCWLRRPGCKFICLSVNQDASHRDARDSRSLITSDWYQQMFQPDWKLKDDQDAISNYGNTSGGVRLSRAQGSEIVGLRGDCVDGKTLVETELGRQSIQSLHEMHQRGEALPLVWSMNHETGETELQRVVATRVIPGRTVVDVRTQTDNVLRCTDDHRIYSQGSYTQATHLRGRAVSIMRRTDMFVENWGASEVQGLPVCDADMCPMLDDIPEARSRVRQARSSRTDGRAILHEILQDGVDESTCDYQAVPTVWRGFSTSVNEGVQKVLLGGVSDQVYCYTSIDEDSGRQRVSPVQQGVSPVFEPNGLLFWGLRRCRTFNTNDGQRELQLLGQPGQDLRWGTLGESSPVDSRERREPLCMWSKRGVERTSIDCAPRRSQPEEQYSREPNHTLRCVPHDTSQVQTATVLSVDRAVVEGRELKVDVYDIQVEGNHNFFANGILVHNCLLIDDPNNPHEAESKTVRDEVNELWETNIFNRVNDPLRSLRIGVQQRTNAADWTGYVLSNQGYWHPVMNPDGWLLVALPAEFEISRRCITPWGKDPRKEDGEPIDRVRMPPEWLVKERKRFGSDKYAGQMQQRPALVEGGRVKRKWWNWCKLASGVRPEFDAEVSSDGQFVDRGGNRQRPAHCSDHTPRVVPRATFRDSWDFDWIVISIDPAAKKTTRGSNYGILVIAGQNERRFILDDRSRRGDILEILAVLKELVGYWRPDKVLIEEKAAGPDLMTLFREQLANGEVRDFQQKAVVTVVEGIEPGAADKEMRLDACIPIIEAGLVYLLDGADWVPEFVEELSLFPNGPHDDRTDALTQCLNHIRSSENTLPDW
jgi:predicted phage terminase large subunit-like protein